MLTIEAQSNLWPLLVILPAPLACLYLIVLAGLPTIARGTSVFCRRIYAGGSFSLQAPG